MRKSFINFRICNHKLPIETGRWRQIDRNLRKCNRCLGNAIGDEFHYVFECPFFDLDRSLIVPFIRRNRANAVVFYNLFNETNFSKLKRLCKFLEIILDSFKINPC